MDQRKRQQFGMLPERNMDWRTLCVSYGAQTLLLLIILMIGVLIPERMGLKQYHATEMVALKPWEPPPPPKIKIKPIQIAKVDIPVPVPQPKLLVPKEIRKPKVEVAEVEAPKFEDKTSWI